MIKTRNGSSARSTCQNIGHGSTNVLPDISKKTDLENLIRNVQSGMEIVVETGDTWALMEVLRKVKHCNYCTFPNSIKMIEFEESFLKGLSIRLKIAFSLGRKSIAVSALIKAGWKTNDIWSNQPKKLNPSEKEIQNILIDLETAYMSF